MAARVEEKAESVGMEAHGMGVQYAVEKAAQAIKMETGRPIAPRQAIMACRPAGHVSVAGV